jgi:hypothetical protein
MRLSGAPNAAKRTILGVAPADSSAAWKFFHWSSAFGPFQVQNIGSQARRVVEVADGKLRPLTFQSLGLGGVPNEGANLDALGQQTRDDTPPSRK